MNISKNIKVLFVEDDAMIRSMFYTMLSSFFDKLEVAIDGKDAL
jgi:CheY-like chemotaxis protein